MARPKRKSPALEKAKTRASSCASIDANLDLGSVTLAQFNDKIEHLEETLDKYNEELSKLDGMLNVLEAEESVVADWTERMLAGVGTKYGKDSDEYEKAGGTRKSERKTPVRKPATPK